MTTNVAPQTELVAPLLLSAREAVAQCGFGLSTWWRYLSSGKVLAPIKIGGSVRWHREELHAWMDAKCPPREKWDVINRRPVKRQGRE